MKMLRRMFSGVFQLFGFAGVALVLGGCVSATGSYTSDAKFDKTIIGPLQKRAIAYQGIYRNPVIIVHGFLGSNMLDKKSGKNVWGKFSGADGFVLSDEKMRALALPMVRYKPLKDIKDDSVPKA